VLWVTFAFAGTLGLNRSMAIEKDRGCLDGLLLAPVDRSAIYFGKVISNLAFMLIVEAIVLPVYSVLYNVNLFQPGAAAGHPAGFDRLCGGRDAARQHGRADPHPRRAAADPALPGGHAGADRRGQGQRRLPDRRPWTNILPWLNLLIAYDVIFTAIAFMVFDYRCEE
jgi:heme exporter protein B